MPSNSWTELPRSESKPPRSGSSSSMPSVSSPVNMITSEIGLDVSAR